MARPPVWLDRLAEIRRSVSNTVGSHYKTSELNDLFQVQGRNARNLMAMLPRYPAGSTFEVAREDLEVFLNRVHETDDVHELFRQIRAERPKVIRRKIRVRRREDGMIEPVNLPRPGDLVVGRGEGKLSWRSPEECMEVALRLVLMIHDDLPGFLRDHCIEEPKPEPAAVEDETEWGEWRGVQEPDRTPILDLRAIARENQQSFEAWMAAKRTPRKTASETGVDTGRFELAASPSLSATTLKK